MRSDMLVLRPQIYMRKVKVLIYMRKVKVLSLPETIKKKSTFRANALRRELVVGVGENHACFYTS